MKIFFFLLFPFINLIFAHVLTVFEGIEEYAINVLDTKYFKWKSLGDCGVDAQQKFCEKIREARIYQIDHRDRRSKLPKNVSSFFKDYIIQRPLAREEKEHIKGNFQKKKITIGNRRFSKKSFTCSAPDDGTYKWEVIHSITQASGFLFTSGKFTAVIDDEVSRISVSSQHELESLFLNSSQTTFNKKESSCFLHSNLKFRLCAVCADKIHSYLHSSSTKIQKRSQGKNMSKNSYSNYYHLQDSFDQNCPGKRVTMKADNVGRSSVNLNILNCAVSLENFEYNFYISRNKLLFSSGELFIIMKDDASSILEVKYLFLVPLLREIDKLNEMLINI